MRFVIKLAFKGTNYHGWQKQQNAHTVQDELDEKLSMLLGEKIETLGCGRTDTGVHASEFFAHFDFDKTIDFENLIHKLNHTTSHDIAVYKITQVDENFNARFDAAWREYEYCICTVINPFSAEFAWQFLRKLDVDAMNSACKILFNYNDFECFSKVQTQVNNFKCELMKAEWKIQDDNLIFTIRANRFLRNMVRSIVGTLIKIGLHEIDENSLKEIIESKKRSEAGQSVPAHGLYLTKVFYPTLSTKL